MEVLWPIYLFFNSHSVPLNYYYGSKLKRKNQSTCWWRRYSDTAIWNGKLQNWWKLGAKFTTRSVSVLMKFTTYQAKVGYETRIIQLTKSFFNGKSEFHVCLKVHDCYWGNIDCYQGYFRQLVIEASNTEGHNDALQKRFAGKIAVLRRKQCSLV